MRAAARTVLAAALALATGAPGVGLLKLVGTRGLFLGTASYTVRGDPPDTDLENTLGASVAGGIRVASADAIFVTLARSDSLFAGGEAVWTGALSYHRAIKNGFAFRGDVLRDLSGPTSGYGVTVDFTYHDEPFKWGS